ncbi:nucleoside hydrolase [Verrucomicrobiaceae bacterium 227]
MKTFLFTFFAICQLPITAEPVKLIFDTDMGNDIDDAQALAMIHALQDRGVVDLLAVTSTKDDPLSAPYIDALNTFYGRPDIPIGAVKDGVTPGAGKYLGIARRKDDSGQLVYPHDLKSGADAMEAVALIRKTLAAQPDGSVVIAQVGFFTNLVRLIDSKPDEYSPLTGEELIRKKVKQLGVMAGAFTTIRGNEHYCEFNVVKDIPSAQTLADQWPGKINWSGFKIGISATYPNESIQNDYDYVADHLIKESYLAYCREGEHRPTWDLTTVLQLVYPDRGYFGLSEEGTVTVEKDGFTVFKGEGGKHRYLTMDEKQSIRVKEAFAQLCSAPPSGLTK